MRPARRTALLASAVSVTLLVAGCGGDAPAAGEGAQESGAAGSPAGSLRDVCPATVVVQTNWWPQAEYGGIYRMLGEETEIDSAAKKVSGPLMSGEYDTGVRLEVRSGGPANGFVPSASLLYSEEEVMLGGVDLDQAVQVTSAKQPVLPVFAPLDVSPLVIMWDPESHPTWNTIGDLGQSDVPVLYFPGATYIEYLVGSGILRRSQVDASYDGSPARFISEDGAVAQQGYLTNEVYAYQNEIPQWGKAVSYQLVADSGYPVYPETLAIRPDRRAELAPCLERLVPIMQQATADFATDPKPTNEFVVELVEEFENAYPYSPERADAAVKAMLEEGILGNGENATVGDFDPDRVQRVLQIVRPIFAGQKQPVPDALAADDLYTNDFVDPAIGLGRD